MMKSIFKILGVGLLLLIAVIFLNVFRAKNIQPKAFDYSPIEIPSTAIENLSSAIQLPTISHKIGMMDTSAFNGLLNLFEEKYPQFHATVVREVLSSHTLLYKWEGSNKELKPQLYMGHIDVVPVEKSTLDQWEYPPFSGEITDEFVWGRGALDDKGTVVGLLETAELLVNSGFKPKHTLYFLFGQDEEILGNEGAVIAVEKFKKEGVQLSFVWDEGTIIGKELVPGIDTEVAMIGISEKGYASFELTANVIGGHSSMPNQENAIGDLSKAISDLQQNPFPYEVSGPIEGFMKYLGPVSPTMNRMAFANPWLFKPLIYKSYAKTGSGRAMIQTTIAPTIFKSGIKENVIPNRAKAIVNCRLLPGHTIESVEEYLKSVINNDNISVAIMEGAQNPSGVTDFNTDEFRTLGSSIRSVYSESYVTPFLMLGATDSRHFEEVADHIFKFAPFVYTKEDLPRLHGINERISLENFKNGIQIYTLAIQKLDELD